jgi:hypothetical protein
MLGQSDLGDIIKEKRGGTFDFARGPCVVAGQRVWEVWVKLGDISETRFIVEPAEGEPLYYESFQKLAMRLDQAANEGARADVHLRKFSAYVAGITFVATLAVMLYLVVRGQGASQAVIVTALLGVTASGSALYFGKWLPFGSGKL